MTVMLFNSLFPVTWVVIIAFFILGVSGWLEIKRNQKFLAVRLTALLLAVFAVVCLIVNPSVPVSKTSTIILLTSGYNPKILDSLLAESPKSQVYQRPGVKEIQRELELTNYRELNRLEGNIFVLGEGLPRYMQDYLDTSSLQYFPSPVADGFITMNPGHSQTENQRGEITGTVKLSRASTLTLTGTGTAEDSVHLKSGPQQEFSLSFTPKTAGLFLYTLTATDSTGKILHTEQVPIQVKKQKPLSVLWVSDYPSAEIRFLKNFLEQENHRLTLRYTISKEKYRTEFINTPAKSLRRLDENLLQSFDLVLTDANSLTSLTRAEITALQEARKNGLGIITLISTPELSKQAQDMLDFKLTRIKSDSARLTVNQQPVKVSAAPASVSSGRNLFSIRQETGGRVVSGYYAHGLGKSGFQLLNHTFRYALTGEHELYAELWTPLLQAVARKEIKPYDLTFTTPFPYYPDEPIEFTIIGGTEKPVVKTGSVEIPVVEDPLIKNIWYGKIWAGQAGWNTVQIDQDSSRYDFFVSQPERWRSMQVFHQQKSMHRLSASTQRTVEKVIHQSLPPILFFSVFLLAAGFLWLVPKL